MQARLLLHIFAATLLSCSAWADLLNVDFGADSRFPSRNKSGLAATGVSSNDYWNFYSADNPDGSWKVRGSLPHLKYANGANSKVGLRVYNASGAWAYGNSDPMMQNYIYSLGPGSEQTILQITGLPAGTYRFFLYGPDTSFTLSVGKNNYGTRVVLDEPVGNSPPWEEGKQYALFTNVTVRGSESVNIYLGAGQHYFQGTVSGMQIEAERPCDNSAGVTAPSLRASYQPIVGFTSPPKIGEHLGQLQQARGRKPVGDFWLARRRVSALW
jgi:hypothetical protein